MDVKPISDIRTRRDFHDAFQSAMSGAHETLRALWHFEKGQNLPKSYLVEFHPKESCDRGHQWSTSTVFSALEHATKPYGGRLRRTDDDTLFWLGNNGNIGSAEFIVDCLNPRFLVFHTISNAEDSDRFILGRLTQHKPEFDLFWFPVAFLERTEARESVIGWESHFEPWLDEDLLPVAKEGSYDVSTGREVLEDDIEDFENLETEAPISHLKQRPRNVHFEYPRAFEIYKRLKQLPDLFPDVPLSTVYAERMDEDRTSYARARLKSNGKITGRGPDFSAYLQMVDGTVDEYAQIVAGLESRYWIRVHATETKESLALRMSGEPFCLRFSRRLNISRLLGLMFNCTGPFRLMGEPEQLGDDYFSVEAIDLHVGQPVAFEVTPCFIRIYLYEGTCGNTLVRIIRSLQHYVDSRLEHPSLWRGGQ
jgi:hypothetical protein